MYVFVICALWWEILSIFFIFIVVRDFSLQLQKKCVCVWRGGGVMHCTTVQTQKIITVGIILRFIVSIIIFIKRGEVLHCLRIRVQLVIGPMSTWSQQVFDCSGCQKSRGHPHFGS